VEPKLISSKSIPQPYATLPASSPSNSPYTVTGTGSSFEGTVGAVFLFNSSYSEVTSANAAAATGVNQTFTAPLTYSVSGASQDGLVALYSYSAADGGINRAVMVKVIIS
jgi:hypothetical protein